MNPPAGTLLAGQGSQTAQKRTVDWELEFPGAPTQPEDVSAVTVGATDFAILDENMWVENCFLLAWAIHGVS